MPKTEADTKAELIRALAEWAVDKELAAHDAGYPKRKRLPKEYYQRELKQEAPTRALKTRKPKHRNGETI